MNPIYLLEQGADTSAAKLIERPGIYIWKVTGTFNGATVALERLGPDGVTWQGEVGLVTNAAVEVPLYVTEDAILRTKITAGTTPSITSYLIKQD